jgi:hypothetical protein
MSGPAYLDICMSNLDLTSEEPPGVGYLRDPAATYEVQQPDERGYETPALHPKCFQSDKHWPQGSSTEEGCYSKSPLKGLQAISSSRGGKGIKLSDSRAKSASEGRCRGGTPGCQGDLEPGALEGGSQPRMTPGRGDFLPVGDGNTVGRAMSNLALLWDVRAMSPSGEHDAVTRASYMTCCPTLRTLAGGLGARTITMGTPYSRVVFRPGFLIDTCSSINLIHVDLVRMLDGPVIESTDLLIKGSTGAAAAHGEVREGEIDLILGYDCRDHTMVRTHFFTTTNNDLRDHPLLGMPFLQAIGAVIHLLPPNHQYSADPTDRPGYGALEYCVRMHDRDASVRRSIPLITSPWHTDPHEADAYKQLDPNRKYGGENVGYQ